MPEARRNRAYSALVTCVAPMRNPSTQTRWTGRSQSCPAVEPIKNQPSRIGTSDGSIAKV